MFTARVPGIGFVDWTEEQINQYADELRRSHQTARLSIEWRRRWLLRWPVLREEHCRRCGEPWPCPSAWWADRWFGAYFTRLAGMR